MSGGTNEQSIKSSYTVLYMLKNKDWQVLGNGGWSEVHLCSDLDDGTFRILAWSVDTQEVLLNSNVNENCVYKASKKSNFHSFTDENSTKYGLGFHKSGDALKQSQEFLETVCAVISDLEGGAAISRGKDTDEKTSGALKSDPKRTHADLEKRGLINKAEYKPLGVLKILPPKPIKHKDSDKNILDPADVKHERHGYFDKDDKKFKGNFPEEWLSELNKQFGVPVHQLPSKSLPTYKSGIPTILLDLKAALKNNDGYQQVGIFRLAPNAGDNDSVKNLINSLGGTNGVSGMDDVNVCANLIKVWFRDLPAPLFSAVKPSLIESSQTVESVSKGVKEFPEPNKSILLWLWDLCVEVAAHKDINKMGPQNLAIVIGPNLFNTEAIKNPMAAMTFSTKVVTFFQRGIEWRLQQGNR